MDNHGIAGPPPLRRKQPNPDGHTDRCWQRAQAHTRRDHGTGDFSVTNQQAVEALRVGEIECGCGAQAAAQAGS